MVEQTFVATDPNPGATISYTMNVAPYSNYFNLVLSPAAHLVTALVIDYSYLTINPLVFGRLT